MREWLFGQRGGWVLALAWCVACLGLLNGCGGGKPTPRAGAPTAETFNEIRRPSVPVPENAGPITVLVVRRVLIPLDASTSSAWALVDEGVLPPISRSVWHNNGMRIGLMDGYKIGQFAEAIPGVLGMQRAQWVAREYPVPILKSGWVDEPIVVDLTIPPRAVQEVRLTRGEPQMIAELLPYETPGGGEGGLRIKLTPHQRIAKVTLTPRDPMEKELDGRWFKELTLHLDLPTGKMLVLGLSREESMPRPESEPAPQPSPRAPVGPAEQAGPISASPAGPPADANGGVDGAGAARDSATAKQTEADGAGQGADANASEPLVISDLPRHFGRALLTASRLGKPAQQLVLISVETITLDDGEPVGTQTRK